MLLRRRCMHSRHQDQRSQRCLSIASILVLMEHRARDARAWDALKRKQQVGGRIARRKTTAEERAPPPWLTAAAMTRTVHGQQEGKKPRRQAARMPLRHASGAPHRRCRLPLAKRRPPSAEPALAADRSSVPGSMNSSSARCLPPNDGNCSVPLASRPTSIANDAAARPGARPRLSSLAVRSLQVNNPR